MAHIVDNLCQHFTGHVGPVRFKDGHADTTDPELVAYFASQPERYAVDEDVPGDQADEDPESDESDEDDTEHEE